MKRSIMLFLMALFLLFTAGCSSHSSSSPHMNSAYSKPVEGTSRQDNAGASKSYTPKTKSDYSQKGKDYNDSQKYYKENDHNNDGKITEKEFQDAVGDFMDDYGF